MEFHEFPLSEACVQARSLKKMEFHEAVLGWNFGKCQIGLVHSLKFIFFVFPCTTCVLVLNFVGFDLT
jgi:hypothetical protein